MKKTLLALFLAAMFARTSAADLLVSSSDPTVNSAVSRIGGSIVMPDAYTAGFSFTVNESMSLDSVVANLYLYGFAHSPYSIEAELFGGSTLLAESGPISPVGNYADSEQSFGFSGVVLNPNSTYEFILINDSSQPSTPFEWVQTNSHSSAFSTLYGSIGMGIYGLNGSNVPAETNPLYTPEATIYGNVLVPEPSSLILLGSGIVGLSWLRRRLG